MYVCFEPGVKLPIAKDVVVAVMPLCISESLPCLSLSYKLYDVASGTASHCSLTYEYHVLWSFLGNTVMW